MSAVLNQDGSLSITAYSLVEFLPDVIEATHNGFVLDMDNNLGYPQQFGTVIALTMFPAGVIEVQEVGKEETVQDKPLSTKDEQAPVADKVVEAPVPEVKVQGTVEGYFSEAVTPPPTGTTPKIDGRKRKT